MTPGAISSGVSVKSSQRKEETSGNCTVVDGAARTCAAVELISGLQESEAEWSEEEADEEEGKLEAPASWREFGRKSTEWMAPPYAAGSTSSALMCMLICRFTYQN
jgi:hypothetical protein